MRNIKFIKFVPVLLVSVLLVSCGGSGVITDVNSEAELQIILENRDEQVENDISDIFENTSDKDITNNEKENSDTEKPVKAETALRENVPDITEENQEIQQTQNSQEVPEIQEVQVTQENRENTEQEKLKPYNDIYVVINGTQEYHRTDCEKLLQTQTEQKSFFTSAKELYFNDILPCTECKPNN